jgi:hypothetical protein
MLPEVSRRSIASHYDGFEILMLVAGIVIVVAVALVI